MIQNNRLLNTRHMKMVRSSPLCTGRLYPQEYPGTHFQRLSRPQGTRKCQLPQNKFQASTLGIDPGSYRLVAYCLNHYATPGPRRFVSTPFLSITDIRSRLVQGEVKNIHSSEGRYLHGSTSLRILFGNISRCLNVTFIKLCKKVLYSSYQKDMIYL